MNKTSIGWTDYSSNPIRFADAGGVTRQACVKLSQGCTHCYAETLAKRYGRGTQFNAAEMAKLTPYLATDELRKMLGYKPASGKRVFIGDMTDIFGEWVPDALLDGLFHVMRMRRDVTWQLLTKRADRLCRYLSNAERPQRIDDAGLNLLESDIGSSFVNLVQHNRLEGWPLPNVWIGVSCEDQPRADERIPSLTETPAAVRFVSAEPLLGLIDFNSPILEVDSVNTIDWVIVGGESGAGYRPSVLSWYLDIADQCESAGVPLFAKQASGPRPGTPFGNARLDALKQFPCQAVTA